MPHFSVSIRARTRLVMAFCCACLASLGDAGASPLSDADIADTTKAAFIWGYPMVDNYNVLYNYALNPRSPEFKAPLNAISHARDVAGPADRAIVAPNVDTPYSYAWLDLRADPIVLSLPEFEKQRYVSLQLIDSYTYILGYVTPRTNGHSGGDFMVVGPAWQGVAPAGIKQVFRSPTELVLAFYRTQILGPGDLRRVHALQDEFKVRTLSAYLRKPAPAPAPALIPVAPLDVRQEPTSLRFFAVLNWMLQTLPALPDEAALRQRFERIGVKPGRAFEVQDPRVEAAMVQGMKAAMQDMAERSRTIRSSAELFGSRDFLKDDYLTRAVAAMIGIYGNSADEYLGVGYQADSTGRPFDGQHRYRIRFAPGGLPPVGAFWSITAYTADRFVYANALNRAKISSLALPELARDADGGITLYVQHQSPGADKESNWLPVPATPFGLTFRTYLPGEAIRQGRWQAPPVIRQEGHP